MEKEYINLNSNSSSPICQSAIDRMMFYLQNPKIAHADLIAAYSPIYELLGASLEDTFVFTSSLAEAINQVFLSVFLEVSRKVGKCHFIASTIEDAPTMQMLKRLEDLGCFVKFVPVNDRGQIDVDALKELISPRTALISITAAHGLTGVIQPLEEIASLAKERGVLLHIEASYAAGKYDFSNLRSDYITFSGERLHAPKSAGLFVKKNAPLHPLVLGNSLDVAPLMALSCAASQILLNFDAMSLEMIRLRDLLETEILAQVSDGIVLFKNQLRLPNTTALLFPGAHYEALHYLLQEKKIASAIGGTYFQHLHRLLASSSIEKSECALSFSIDRMMTEEEILKAAKTISLEVNKLRALSEDL
jgi:cysteine desulfurase